MWPDGDSRDLVVGAALALGSFGVYAWGSCRTIYVGDSGELVTAVHLLGIPGPRRTSSACTRSTRCSCCGLEKERVSAPGS